MEERKKGGSFSGSLGFILAAAGSAVGLGNIWRFPYLAAKGGGGVFLLCYVVLALTFGFALLTTEIAIGRKTGKSPLTAYGTLHQNWKWIGPLAGLVPTLILPYYSVIGGWILKYLTAFLTGHAEDTVAAGYFKSFTSELVSPILWFVVYLVVTSAVVFMGVDKGIERLSKFLMPVLIVMILGISIFSLTLSYTDETGVTRTGMQGLVVYAVPNFKGMTFQRFAGILMDAMGQLFYSISVAMGIMITYGSYVKKDVNLVKSVNHIEIFDSAVAFLAGMMIVPAVYTFMGMEGMGSGPSLMFVSLPRVFAEMGGLGKVAGTVFFLMVAFAALTSSVSIMEAVVACVMDFFHMKRHNAVVCVAFVTFALGILVCLGYNVLFFNITLPNGTAAQVLDVMDYIANYCLMPVIAVATCILVGWVLGPDTVINEIELGGVAFGRKKLYVVMVRFVAPVMLIFLLMQSFGLIA